MNKLKTPKKTVFDVFVRGASKGFVLGTTGMLPNLILAFVLIKFLSATGLLDVAGKIFEPVMALFGLPGQTATTFLTSWLSVAGGPGNAVALYQEGYLTTDQMIIMFPGMFLMGSQVQYLARILGTAGVKSKYYHVMYFLGILNAILSMLIMRFILRFYQ